MRKTIVALGCAALVTGCLSTGPTEVAIGVEFELTPNQSARVIGTDWTIAFRGVAGDTRCPVDLLCLVAGDAGVQLDIFGTDADNPLQLGLAPPRNTWSDTQFQVRIVDLSPTPSADRVINPDEYRLRLIVEPVGS